LATPFSPQSLILLTRAKGICLDFAIRTTIRHRELDGASLDPKFSALRSSKKFRGFLAALTIATICIFIRSVYRVAELSEGWTGHLIRQQWLFVGLEGVMVAAAVITLNIFHPAFCFEDGFGEFGAFGGIWCFKSRRQGEPSEEGKPAGV
jgi:hypothetical protein